MSSIINELEALIYNGKQPDQEEDVAKYEQMFLSSFYDTEGEGFHYGKKRQGAEILYDRLKKIDLKAEIEKNRNIMFFEKAQKKVETAIKKVRIFENFLTTKTRPEWIVLYLSLIHI